MLNIEDVIRAVVRYELRRELERPELLQRFRQALDDEIGRLIVNEKHPEDNAELDVAAVDLENLENPMEGDDNLQREYDP